MRQSECLKYAMEHGCAPEYGALAHRDLEKEGSECSERRRKEDMQLSSMHEAYGWAARVSVAWPGPLTHA